MKWLPRDVAGEELPVLGATIAAYAVTWQIHLQAHGQPSVFDDTA